MNEGGKIVEKISALMNELKGQLYVEARSRY